MGYRQPGVDAIARFPEYAPYFQLGVKARNSNAKPGVTLKMLKLFRKGVF